MLLHWIRVELRVMAMKEFFIFSKFQDWRLRIRLFNVISRTLIQEYYPSRLVDYNQTEWEKLYSNSISCSLLRQQNYKIGGDWLFCISCNALSVDWSFDSEINRRIKISGRTSESSKVDCSLTTLSPSKLSLVFMKWVFFCTFIHFRDLDYISRWHLNL